MSTTLEQAWNTLSFGEGLELRPGRVFREDLGFGCRNTRLLTVHQTPTTPTIPIHEFVEAEVPKTIDGALTISDHEITVPEAQACPALRSHEIHANVDAVLEHYRNFRFRETVQVARGCIPQGDGPNDVSEFITRLACHPRVGNLANRKWLTASDVLPAVTSALHDYVSIPAILPALPFKSRNIFRTGCNHGGHADLGEAAFLIALEALTRAVQVIYPPGIDWVIASDGTAYQEMFEVGTEAVEIYAADLYGLRDRLGLRHVHFIDLKNACERVAPTDVPELGSCTFREVYKKIQYHLRDMDRAGQYAKKFAKLRYNMARLIRNDDLLGTYSPEQLWSAYNAGGRGVPVLEVRRERAVFEYFAHRLTTSYLAVGKVVFPSSIRATTHPGPGKVTVPSLRGYPWNGLALLEHVGTNPSVRVIDYPTLADQNATGVRSGKVTFYYQI